MQIDGEKVEVEGEEAVEVGDKLWICGCLL